MVSVNCGKILFNSAKMQIFRVKVEIFSLFENLRIQYLNVEVKGV